LFIKLIQFLIKNQFKQAAWLCDNISRFESRCFVQNITYFSKNYDCSPLVCV